MKLTTLALFLGFTASSQASLIITGAFDGPQPGGEPKVVELYATGDIADLSLYGVGVANNGGGTDGVETILSGSATEGEFLYVVQDQNFNGSLGGGFNAFFGFTPSQLFDGSFSNGGGAATNGDDAIELFFDAAGTFVGGESVIDTFGNINVDGTGQPWDYLDGWVYRNDATGPDGSTFNFGNWSFSGINVNDGQTDNASHANPFPVGTYAVPEPSSLLLSFAAAGLIFRRRRS